MESNKIIITGLIISSVLLVFSGFAYLNSIVHNFIQENKIDINDKNNNKETPLIIAAKKNNVDLVRELLKAGAKIDIVSSANKTAKIYTLENSNYTMLKIIEDCESSRGANHFPQKLVTDVTII